MAPGALNDYWAKNEYPIASLKPKGLKGSHSLLILVEA